MGDVSSDLYFRHRAGGDCRAEVESRILGFGLSVSIPYERLSAAFYHAESKSCYDVIAKKSLTIGWCFRAADQGFGEVRHSKDGLNVSIHCRQIVGVVGGNREGQ